MSFRDFQITSAGQTWIAEAVAAGGSGEPGPVVDYLSFGEKELDESGMASEWKRSEDNLRVNSRGENVTISGVVDNRGTTVHYVLNRIELWGHSRSDLTETAKLLMFANSDFDEPIPLETEQLLTRRAVIQIAISGQASVTLSGAMSGYAAEDEVVKSAGKSEAYRNDEGIVCSSTDSFGTERSVAIGPATVDSASVAAGRVSCKAVGLRVASMPNMQSQLTPNSLVFAGFGAEESEAKTQITLEMPVGYPEAQTLRVKTLTDQRATLEVIGKVKAENIPCLVGIKKETDGLSGSVTYETSIGGARVQSFDTLELVETAIRNQGLTGIAQVFAQNSSIFRMLPNFELSNLTNLSNYDVITLFIYP